LSDIILPTTPPHVQFIIITSHTTRLGEKPLLLVLPNYSLYVLLLESKCGLLKIAVSSW